MNIWWSTRAGLSFYLRNVSYTRYAFRKHWFWSAHYELHRFRNRLIWALARLLDRGNTLSAERNARATYDRLRQGMGRI